jgi:hypothetical protein
MHKLIANGNVAKFKGLSGSARAMPEYRLWHALRAPYTTHLSEIIEYQNGLACDSSGPARAPQELLKSCRLITIDWRPRMDLKAGLRSATFWFDKHK